METEKKGTILNLTLRSSISDKLKVDQSVSHDGVCLTIVEVKDHTHRVQLVDETLRRSHFAQVKKGESINLERSMSASGRFEGHIVQGHVDCTGKVISVKDGVYTIQYPVDFAKYVVEKGSICVNGVSLTIASLREDMFSVAIIPYTLEYTNFKDLSPGDIVNLEFDILAKHLARIIDLQMHK